PKCTLLLVSWVMVAPMRAVASPARETSISNVCADSSLVSPSVLEYARRRRAAIFEVRWIGRLARPQVQSLESPLPDRITDSLRAALDTTRWPSDIGPAAAPHTESIVLCTDRTESSAQPAAVHLPPFVRRALSSGLPAAWVSAHVALDSAFGID